MDAAYLRELDREIDQLVTSGELSDDQAVEAICCVLDTFREVRPWLTTSHTRAHALILFRKWKTWLFAKYGKVYQRDLDPGDMEFDSSAEERFTILKPEHDTAVGERVRIIIDRMEWASGNLRQSKVGSVYNFHVRNFYDVRPADPAGVQENPRIGLSAPSVRQQVPGNWMYKLIERVFNYYWPSLVEHGTVYGRDLEPVDMPPEKATEAAIVNLPRTIEWLEPEATGSAVAIEAGSSSNKEEKNHWVRLFKDAKSYWVALDSDLYRERERSVVAPFERPKGGWIVNLSTMEQLESEVRLDLRYLSRYLVAREMYIKRLYVPPVRTYRASAKPGSEEAGLVRDEGNEK